jgi:hypothetical protein
MGPAGGGQRRVLMNSKTDRYVGPSFVFRLEFRVHSGGKPLRPVYRNSVARDDPRSEGAART